MEAHRGEILRKTLKKYCDANGATLVFIAKQVGYDQSTLYKHFERDNLPFHIIRKYGKAISHDFLIEFPEMKEEFQYINESQEHHPQTSHNESSENADHWKQKYIELLERHNALLMKMIAEKK
ncbi:hypothetical protein [Peijinzhouia sedimentorum]